MLRPRFQSTQPPGAWDTEPQSILQPAQHNALAGQDGEAEAALETLRGMLGAHPGLSAILDDPAAYPAKLLALAARNPETIPFVLGWPGHTQPAAPADTTPETARGSIPKFYQWDARWGYASYAGGIIGLDGCGPVVLSMALCALADNASGLDPLTIAQYADRHGHSNPAYGTAWSLMTKGAAGLGFAGEELPLDKAALRAAAGRGEPVILSVREGDFTTTGHFILIAGTNADGSFIVHDPNSMANTAKSWTYERLAPQIKNLWAISMP